ncbi:serine/threonine protein kinase [Plasmodium vinckei petteri]|uniref:Protein kinase, putative n=1 Tax=Plasmodium vinckei petteri TaxID=138298 RepID=W7B1L1_PLAVN|nr:serine/threonine protein kinase [Plasmodium vinckei petteri]CAD2098800.1 protein kinase, putative [Plasmodium vinckei petteri]
MSKWGLLVGEILWPKEFIYVIENEGCNNKFGHSYVIKYNGNIVHKNLKKSLNNVDKMLNATKSICVSLEQQRDEYDPDSLNYENKISDESTNANQILLRLSDKKQGIKEQLSKINTIQEKYDILLKNEPCYNFRFDFPYFNIQGDPLVEKIKNSYFSTRNGVINSHQNYQGNFQYSKNRTGKTKRNENSKGYRSYLYNIKIIDCDETIVGGREFIFSEDNSDNIKINKLIKEGKYIKNSIYEYKEYCKDMASCEENEESHFEGEEKESKPNGKHRKGHKGENTKNAGKNSGKNDGNNSGNNEGRNNEVTYESVGVVPYSDIIVLSKKEVGKKNKKVAGFVTPFLLNGNIKKMIENISPYNKYKFNDEMIFKSLCNIIKVMNYFEEKNIVHGNIKPSNLFISNNGFHILIGNFVPKIKLSSYYFYVINKTRTPMKYISPELLFYIKKKTNQLKKNINKNKVGNIDKYLIKNDIFCLGLSFYYIITMNEDILNHIDDSRAFQYKVNNIKSFVKKPELFFLLKNLLIYDHVHRPSWLDLSNLIAQMSKGVNNSI